MNPYNILNEDGYGWRLQVYSHNHGSDEYFKSLIGDKGWKLHISATTEAAQQELLALTRRYHIPSLKYWSHPEEKQQILHNGEVDKQYGKNFVIYCSERNGNMQPIDWQAFVNEADAIVRKHGGAGIPVRGSRKIPGSAGMFYCCDRNENGMYISREAGSWSVREGELDIGERYKRIAGMPDPFADIMVGDAKRCAKEQIDMLHAIYAGDFEDVRKLLKKDASLTNFVEPGTRQTMTELASQLAGIERVIAAKGEPYFKEIIATGDVITGHKEHALTYDIKFMAREGRLAKVGQAILCMTDSVDEAKALGLRFKAEQLFDAVTPLRTSMLVGGDKRFGVLVPGSEFIRKFPELSKQIDSASVTRV